MILVAGCAVFTVTTLARSLGWLPGLSEGMGHSEPEDDVRVRQHWPAVRRETIPRFQGSAVAESE